MCHTASSSQPSKNNETLFFHNVDELLPVSSFLRQIEIAIANSFSVLLYQFEIKRKCN